jgi:tetratricopeptide (TPR) repeat protein
MAMVNSSIAYARLGETALADKNLQDALKAAPDNAAAHFNMGLLKAEMNEPRQAEGHLRKAIQADPRMAEAAYNLCVITSKDRIDEAVTWCRKAVELRPQDPDYAYTLAVYLVQKGERDEAAATLRKILAKHPDHRDAGLLLRKISSGTR